MHNNLEQILEELYQTDPTLREHDSALRKLVVDLMALKPDTQFDEQFRQELRSRIMAMAHSGSFNQQNYKEQNQKPSLINMFMKRFQLLGAGVALVAVLFASAWYLNDVKQNSGSNFTTMLTGPKIIKAGSNAFGSLANLQQGARGQGGGGNGNFAATAESSGTTVSPVPAVDAGVNTGFGGGGDAKMIAPYESSNIKYVYKGEELTLIQDQVSVLKRQKNENAGGLSGFINRLTMGLLNFNSFSNIQFQSFSFAEDKDKGYMVNVSLNEGSVNINENWPKWQSYIMPPCATPMSDSISSTISYCEPKRIDISEIPADQVVIDTANQFLDDRGIPRSVYGEPFVNSDWRMQYERAEDKANYWIPDIVSVVYPLILEGQPVYDESGNRSGMNVSVRISPQISVSSVWDLTTQNYQSSDYPAETDVDRIMKLVEKGGFRNYYYSDPGANKTIEVELGTPEMSYVKLWNYNNGNGEELLVPALIFPITKEPTDVGPYYWYRKNVVIPLVKEILDNENPGDVRILPAGDVELPAVDPVKPTPAVKKEQGE